MRVCLLLADGAHSVAGRLYVLGGGLRSVTLGMPHSICGTLEVDYLEATQPHEVCLELLDDEKEPVLAVPPSEDAMETQPVRLGPIRIDTGIPAGHPIGTNVPMAFAFTAAVGPPAMISGQRYFWRLTIDGKSDEDWEVGFVVSAPPPQMLQKAA